ncbi:MAG: oligosaccharide flippase family protein, partial [Planctomycetota bacterium]|nr:oligosaccharide flippase family protein [Planctomycetota bacterium]
MGRSSLGGLARVHPGFRAKSPCLLVGISLLTASRSALTLILERLVGPGAAGALGRGALATLIVNLIAAVFGLLLHVALTWFLGNETEYGIYLVAVSAINLLVIPIIAGWDTVLTRFLSQYGKDGLTDKSRHLYAEASRKLLLRCCVALPLLALVLIPILNYGFPRSWAAANAWTYGVVIACVPPLALSLLRQGALKGLHRPAASLLPESIVKPLSVIGVLLLLISLGNRPTGTLALFSHLGASILAFLLGTLLLPRMLRRGWLRTIFSERVPQTSVDSNQGVGNAEENPRKAAWKSLAVSATIMGLSFVVLSRIDEFLLGIMDSPATAGLYGPASRYAMFVTFGLSVVNPMLGALIARHQDDRAELQRLVKRSARLAAIISTPLAMGMMFA